MSTFSLPRFTNGTDAASDRRRINHNKYASLNNRKSASFAESYFSNKYDMAKRDGFVPLTRCESDFTQLAKNPINRNGTIAHNQFRGIKRAQLERQTRIFLHSMTTEELYEEMLYTILHNVGCDAENEICQSALFSYIQDAFKMVNERHDEILKTAESKEPPEIRLNVEIIEAKELQPKDPNGMSDPFVTMYIASSPSHRYNTSVKPGTLNPTWEEHFSLPIILNPSEDTLVLEVWDFDPAETIGEKMSKFLDIKGVKGFRKLMKEIAVTASTGKHDNELIGRTNIPLKSIPASGLVLWYNLEKKSKAKRQGLIKIRLEFSAEKNNKVAAQEHLHLLRILLMHELELSRVAPYWWSGKFTTQGEAIIIQHAAQSGLTTLDRALSQWSAYTSIHVTHPLAFSLFESLLDKLIRFMQTTLADDEIKMFWDGVKKLLPSCFSVIRKMRKRTAGDKNSVKVLTEVLSIISRIASLEPPSGIDLIPKNVYGWLERTNDLNMREVVRQAVCSGAQEYLHHVYDINDNETGTDEDKLQNVIKITQLIRSDLQRGIEFYDKIFQQKLDFPYTATCFIYFEDKLADSFKTIIEKICKNLKRIQIPEDPFEHLEEHKELNMGTTLFDVYLVLRRFAVLGTALAPDASDFKINHCYEWFTTGVSHWCDISVYKALIRVEKAIEIDKLVQSDETNKFSSSPVDTLSIFYQIKIFWDQLDWPDAEGAYMFLSKIVDDICRCCIYYADRMSIRVANLGEIQNVYENKFEVTREWCLAINNIDFLRQSLSPFLRDELKIDDVIAKIGEFRSSLEAERCSNTLKAVIENALDIETNKILELIESVARKMCPPMRKFLLEGAELLHQDSNSMERLMMYLEESLTTLREGLNEVNFERVLEAIWTELSAILYELVQSNLDKRRPPQFFSNLRETLRILIKCFKTSQSCAVTSNNATLDNIEQLLQLHGYETSDLIHQYYKERHRDQSQMTGTPFGQLTVRCWFKDSNTLEIEVMNARNLIPACENGNCDPFVRIYLIPEDKFSSANKPKTNAQSKTLFPLFDEKFVISLTNEQRAVENAVILFAVKDKDYFGITNQFIAECYMTFQDIVLLNGSREQIHLKLNRPNNSVIETECVRALDHRQGDKQAKEFIKKLKQKLTTS